MKPVQRAIQPPLLGLVDKIVSLEKWDASRPHDLQKRHIRFQIGLSFFGCFWASRIYLLQKNTKPSRGYFSARPESVSGFLVFAKLNRRARRPNSGARRVAGEPINET